MSDFLEIPLAGGKGVALVDREDWAGLSKYSWHNSNGYARTIIHGKTVAMHRMVLGLGDSELVCDHINHNKLDNRRLNLRACTHKQNCWNSLHRFDRRYKGVWKISDSLYFGRITLNKKQTYIGSFRTEVDAAKAYNLAALKYFGEFACLNDVDHSIRPDKLNVEEILCDLHEILSKIFSVKKFGWFDIYDDDDIKQEMWIIMNDAKGDHDPSKGDPLTFFFTVVKNKLISLQRTVLSPKSYIDLDNVYGKNYEDATELTEEILDFLDQRMRADMLRMLDGMKIDKNRADQLRRKVRSILEDMEYYG